MDNTAMDRLIAARRVVRFMGMGIMPSEQLARDARHVLHEVTASDYGDLPSKGAIRVTGAIAMGLAPSQEQCALADAEIGQLVEAMREGHSQSFLHMHRQRN